MTNKVVVRLDDREYALLLQLAEIELRSLSDQLRQILRDTLVQKGLAQEKDFSLGQGNEPPVEKRTDTPN
jgi:hypothetical protein